MPEYGEYALKKTAKSRVENMKKRGIFKNIRIIKGKPKFGYSQSYKVYARIK
jgi:hypothetical protein